jgi:hypothetical protein
MKLNTPILRVRSLRSFMLRSAPRDHITKCFVVVGSEGGCKVRRLASFIDAMKGNIFTFGVPQNSLFKCDLG